MRALGALIASLCATSGCVYGIKSLPERPRDVSTVGPNDAATEVRRRSHRRVWALVGGAIEVGLGALTRYAYSRSSADDDRLFLGTVSEALLVVGAADIAVATIDAFLGTPFVDPTGAFRSPGTASDPALAPSGRLQADAGLGVSVAFARAEGHVDAGVFHWVRPQLRMRYFLGFDRGAELSDDPLGPGALYLGAGAGAALEWSLGGRRHYGRHARFALVVAASPRVVWGDAQPTAFGWRSSVGFAIERVTVGVGATHIVGEGAPSLELLLTFHPFSTD